MKIYHYTSIESLALILNNKTIRFSRLDKVDDPEEFQFCRDGINPALYTFVSCWVKSREESIPQWNLYANRGHGVRIGLECPFNIFIENGKYNFFPNSYFSDKNYCIMPFVPNGQLLFDVEYVDNVKQQYRKIFDDIGLQHTIDFKNVGIYKGTGWAFQNECRYKMTIMPFNTGRSLLETINRGITLNFDFIDIPIKQNAFENMEIVIGHKTTDSERIIIDSLLQKFTTNVQIHNSVFS